MIRIERTNSSNPDFTKLVELLNAYLEKVDGSDHSFYMQYNGIESLKHVVLAYENNIPVGCGSFKKYSEESTEIKRMYTNPESRGTGIASEILEELENWSKELGFKSCILETGKRQIEAVNFYKKMNYSIVPNFDPYHKMENSSCYKKSIL
ncbi:GNAT family N-acetyltransferase [Seonamhaeicola maritimus]|uniref:GNAT family N-acetyltransferase n=1 Tax=Seonamhaeicola maritimus TaxID=2591822 RepID=UPI0024955E38|nr:GNAT family N-acetyltransferase [Seonamhaeicola maritimus]